MAPDFDDRIRAVWRFLEVVFRVPVNGPESFDYLPAIDEVISLVDWSLHVNQGLGCEYDQPRLYQIRRDLEHLLACSLDVALAASPAHSVQEGGGPHAQFARNLAANSEPGSYALVSLNYDTLLDNALTTCGGVPNYGLGEPSGSGPFLAKLHGSLNWALCPACSRILITGVGSRLRCHGCGNEHLHALMVSPTWLKNYAGFRLQPVWELALQHLQQASRIVFVGYSMPPSDVAVYQLIRRGILANCGGRHPRIEVINHQYSSATAGEREVRQAAVKERFTRLFGKDVRFDFSGFHGQI